MSSRTSMGNTNYLYRSIFSSSAASFTLTSKGDSSLQIQTTGSRHSAHVSCLTVSSSTQSLKKEVSYKKRKQNKTHKNNNKKSLYNPKIKPVSRACVPNTVPISTPPLSHQRNQHRASRHGGKRDRKLACRSGELSSSR